MAERVHYDTKALWKRLDEAAEYDRLNPPDIPRTGRLAWEMAHVPQSALIAWQFARKE